MFSVPKKDDGLVVKATRADALKYCQDNYPNGGLPVVTATADWLTLAGIRLIYKKKLINLIKWLRDLSFFMTKKLVFKEV